METEKYNKIDKLQFNCSDCNYKTFVKSNFNKHLMTRKHKILSNDTKSIVTSNVTLDVCVTNEYTCDNCDRSYKNRSGLWKHKKMCDTNNKEIIIDLLKKMDEKDKQIMELLPKVGNTTNNTTTNNFNLQVFLNEDCKDAINWKEFINSIQLDLSSLKELKDSNITKSITDAICNRINELGVYKRPIHCVDQKRKKICIKNEEEWENEEYKVDNLINSGDKCIQKEYIKLISEWENEHPNWSDNETLIEEYMDLSNKIYQNIDGIKLKTNIMKETSIPK
tara:strand:- start:141 stop:977 length:837 start_codon:yes stop_codon:yes gene_type:complete